MTIPNHLDNLLDRLYLNHTEVSSEAGLNKVFKTFPLGNVVWDFWPFVMVSPGPAQYTYPAKSYVDILRNLTVTAIVAPRTQDVGIDGESKAVLDSIGIENALLNYYIAHPRLATAELSDLPYLDGVLMLNSRGVILEGGQPDAKTGKYPEYAGVQITLATMIRQHIENSDIEWRFTT